MAAKPTLVSIDAKLDRLTKQSLDMKVLAKALDRLADAQEEKNDIARFAANIASQAETNASMRHNR